MPLAEGRPMKLLTIYLLLALCASCAQASDLARELQMRQQLDDASLRGEPTTLETGNIRFFAIRSEAQTTPTRGAVILAHERAAHPDWRDVIHPLRTRLPEHGWETLSLQMPLAALDAPERAYAALVAEAAPRLAFAVELLAQRQFDPIIVIGHGLGASMIAQWLASGDAPTAVRGFVAIGLPVDTRQPLQGNLAALRTIRLPLLDIYGSRDIKPVLRTVQARKAAARSAQNDAYTQVEIEGADHFFRGLDETLTARIRAWMARLADSHATAR